MDIIEWYRLTSEKAAGSIVHRKPISYPLKGIRRAEHVERWTRLRKLGEGGFGVVWLEKEETGKLRAVKEVRKKFSKERGQDYLRELLAMAWFSKDQACFPSFQGWFEDDINISIAMEYFELGDLSQCVSGPLPESEAKSITFQIAEALAMLHSKAITHRDVKPGNIFVFRKSPFWWVKLGDFGISKRVQDADTALYTGFTGDYVAPEINAYVDTGEDEVGTYTNAVDIWALGCLIHWLLAGQVPFKKKGSISTYCGNKGGVLPVDLTDYNVSNTGVEFVQKCLAIRPKARPTAQEALASAWLSEGLATVPSASPEVRRSSESARLSMDERRLSIADIKEALESAISSSDDPTVVAANTQNSAKEPSIARKTQRPSIRSSDSIIAVVGKNKFFVSETLPFREVPSENVAQEEDLKTVLRNVGTVNTSSHLRATVEDYYSDDQDVSKSAKATSRGTAQEQSDGITNITPLSQNQNTNDNEMKQRIPARPQPKVQDEFPVAPTSKFTSPEDKQAPNRNQKQASARSSNYHNPLRSNRQSPLQANAVTVTAKPALDIASETNRLLAAAPAFYETDAARLHWIVRGGHVEVIKYCLDNGADVETRHRNAPFLYTAAQYGQEEMVNMLLDRGANIEDGQGDYGGTALHIAAAAGHVGIVKTLIARGAYIDAQDIDGDTPLDHAYYRTSYVTASILYQAGAMFHGDPGNKSLETVADRRLRRAVQAIQRTQTGSQAHSPYSSHSTGAKSSSDEKMWVLVRDLEKNKTPPSKTHPSRTNQDEKPKKRTEPPGGQSKRSKKASENVNKAKSKTAEPGSTSGPSKPHQASTGQYGHPRSSNRRSSPTRLAETTPFSSGPTSNPSHYYQPPSSYTSPPASTRAHGDYGSHLPGQAGEYVTYPPTSTPSTQESMGYYGGPTPSATQHGYYGDPPYAQTNSVPGYYGTTQPNEYGSYSSMPTYIPPYPTYIPPYDPNAYPAPEQQYYYSPPDELSTENLGTHNQAQTSGSTTSQGYLDPSGFHPYNPADYESGNNYPAVASASPLLASMLFDGSPLAGSGGTGNTSGDAAYHGGSSRDHMPPLKREDSPEPTIKSKEYIAGNEHSYYVPFSNDYKRFSPTDSSTKAARLPEESKSRSRRRQPPVSGPGRITPATLSRERIYGEPYKADPRRREAHEDASKTKSRWKSMLGLS